MIVSLPDDAAGRLVDLALAKDASIGTLGNIAKGANTASTGNVGTVGILGEPWPDGSHGEADS